MINLKIDNLDTKHITLNGESISAIVSEQQIDAKDAAVLQEAKDYTDEHSSGGGGGMSIYYIPYAVYGLCNEDTTISPENFKQIFPDLYDYDSESMIFVKNGAELYVSNETEDDVILYYYSLDSENEGGEKEKIISAFSSASFGNGIIYFDSKHNKLWFSHGF